MIQLSGAKFGSDVLWEAALQALPSIKYSIFRGPQLQRVCGEGTGAEGNVKVLAKWHTDMCDCHIKELRTMIPVNFFVQNRMQLTVNLPHLTLVIE